MADSSALTSVINELVTTERSYVKRLRTLKRDYADPLRRFSRSKDTSILPTYEAKTLFGNVDNLLPVNEAFLTDLEKMMVPNGAKTVGGVGDVALRHFKDLRGFEHYKQYYVKREEAQIIFEREMSKKSSGFAAFIEVRVSIRFLVFIWPQQHSSTLNTHRRIRGTGSVCVSSSWTQYSVFPGTHSCSAP